MGRKYEITDKVMTPVRSIRSRFTIDFPSQKNWLEISREYPTTCLAVQTDYKHKRVDVVPEERVLYL